MHYSWQGSWNHEYPYCPIINIMLNRHMLQHHYEVPTHPLPDHRRISQPSAILDGQIRCIVKVNGALCLKKLQRKRNKPMQRIKIKKLIKEKFRRYYQS